MMLGKVLGWGLKYGFGLVACGMSRAVASEGVR
jgi:hypothetical protein